MPLPFEFVMSGVPVSQQARRRGLVREWVQNVQRVAEERWEPDEPVGGAVAVTITYFFQGERAGRFDVDNMPKPILDALKGTVYEDDSQVFDLHCRKRDRGLDLQIPDASPSLLESLVNEGPLLHVSVVEAAHDEVPY